MRAPDVAAALRGVLAAESGEEARRDLDELGYRALDEASAAEAEPGVASGFGGAPSPEDQDQDPTASDAAEADGEPGHEGSTAQAACGPDGTEDPSAEGIGATRATGRTGSSQGDAGSGTAEIAAGTASSDATGGSGLRRAATTKAGAGGLEVNRRHPMPRRRRRRPVCGPTSPRRVRPANPRTTGPMRTKRLKRALVSQR